MSQVVKVKEVVTYGGHSISANGSVNFTLKAQYSELTNTIQVMQLLNNDINIKAKIAGMKPMKLGTFRIKNITIDGDGESTIKFNGISDYIEVDNLNTLPVRDSDTPLFNILMEAEVEEEDDNDGDDEE